jgi:hypothetical protein
MILISIILLFIAFISKGIMDTLQFHYNRSIYFTFKNQHWWDPSKSWANKYAFKNKFLLWIFKGPLVFLTDAWHFFQFVFLNSMFVTIAVNIGELWIIYFVCIRILYYLGFALGYK